MSAISTIQTKDELNQVVAESIAEATESLTEATANYAALYVELVHLQRAAASQILNALDREFPVSQARLKVRKAVLDGLAHYSREVQRWVSPEEADSAMPSPDSTDSEKS